MKPIITLHSDSLHYMDVKLSNPNHVEIPQGVTVIIGPNGSGKTTLAKVIEKGWNIRTNKISGLRDKMSIKSIEFSDIHSLAGFSVEYYQQRFEAMMNDDVPTVASLMGKRVTGDRWKHLCTRLNLHDVENKRINYLSSGELRKLLLINLLFELPDLLIIDNPYIGLDSASRQLLNETVAQIASQGVSVIMLLCNPIDIPPFTDTVIPLTNFTIGLPVYRQGAIDDMRQSMYYLFDYAVDVDNLPSSKNTGSEDFDIVFSLNNCNVKYGNRVILENVSWTVRSGECWALAGPNGSGKSTLLSLVHADNPQGYSNDIILFDRQRGTGESIWDIKRRIGYISPEMHLYFNGTGNVTSIIAQGLNDTIGDYKVLKDAQINKAKKWMKALHIEHLAERRFNTLSAGEQRLVLLARTFIKQPRLLILDEPLHGLDSARKRSVRAIINHLVARERLTLIYVTHYLPEVPDCVTHTKTLSRITNQ